GSTWINTGAPHSGISVTAIQCLASGVVYVGYESMYGVERTVGAQYAKPLREVIANGGIRTIAVQKIDSAEELIVAQNNTVLSLRNDTLVRSYSVLSTPNALLLSNNGLIYVGGNNGVFEEALFGDTLLTPSASGRGNITALVQVADRDVIAVTNGDSIWEYL